MIAKDLVARDISGTHMHTLLRFYMRRYSAFLTVSLYAASVVAITLLCEYYIASAGDMQWRQQTTGYAVFIFVIHAVRFLAACAIVGAWVLWSGALLRDDPLSARDAVVMGGYRSFRCGTGIFLIWFLGFVYGCIVAGFLRFVWIVFQAAGIIPSIIASGTGLSFFLPLIIIMCAKSVFLLPMSVYTYGSAFDLIARSLSRMPFRRLAREWWPFMAVCGVTLACGIVLPSWGLFTMFWRHLYGVDVSALQIFISQLCALSLFLGLGSVGVYLVTYVYCRQVMYFNTSV